jgi:hypothetical protein
MSTLAPTAAGRAALERLIDDAGLFPPAQLAMEPALARYEDARAGAQAWMLGRFIVPASRLPELQAAAPQRARLELSVIVDVPGDSRTWFAGAASAFERIARERAAQWASIRALEVPLPRLQAGRETYDALIGQCAALAERTGLRDLAIHVEVPRDERFIELLQGVMTALSRYRLSAKLRCGGADASAYPSVAEVAAFIGGACEAGVAFKATAGLHHPVRQVNTAAGVTMHGFLNVLAAAACAPSGDLGLLEAIVAEEDPAAFTLTDALRWRDRQIGEADLQATRRHRFVSFGSCSFDEPVNGLRA